MTPWRDLCRRLLALQRLIVRLKKTWLDWTGRSGQVYFHHRVAEYREMWRAVAEELGGEFVPLAEDLWEIEVAGQDPDATIKRSSTTPRRSSAGRLQRRFTGFWRRRTAGAGVRRVLARRS